MKHDEIKKSKKNEGNRQFNQEKEMIRIEKSVYDINRLRRIVFEY